ncbi:MAG: XdhC family protein, partial [Calditrichaeota bacterium]
MKQFTSLRFTSLRFTFHVLRFTFQNHSSLKHLLKPMKELQEILQEIQRLEKAGKRYAIATVVKVSGSTYRGPGARMLVSEDGSTVGNISGGCLESDVIANAKEVIATGKPRLVSYDTTAEEDIFWGTGLGCGGITHIFIEPQPLLQPFLKRVQQDIQHHQPVTAATVFEVQGELPITPGSRLMVEGDSVVLNTIP